MMTLVRLEKSKEQVTLSDMVRVPNALRPALDCRSNGAASSTDRRSLFSGYEGLMNEHHALVSIKKIIKAASDLDDIEAVRDQLHTMLLVANYALPPVQRKPTKK
jgi:hypothetical protein